MKLLSFRLHGFAQLNNIELDFADGVPSLILGPNESGKSHLLAALIGTLFGLTPSAANACTPWDGEPTMCASLDFEAEGEHITLTRWFLDERVDVRRDGETIYSGRGRTFGRGIAEDERYRLMLAGWLGFSEMDIFRDLVFVEQDQLSDERLNKQAPEIKRLITGSREASYETAIADLTADLDKLKKLPRRRTDREIDRLRQQRANLLERINIAEQNEAAVIDLRESELETRAQLADVQTRRATLAELVEAHGRLVTLQIEFKEQSSDFERANRDWENARSSAHRQSELADEVARLHVPDSPDLDTLRRTRFELDDVTHNVRQQQALLDASARNHRQSDSPMNPPVRHHSRARGWIFLAAIIITLLSLLLAMTVSPSALFGLSFAFVLTFVVLLLPGRREAVGPPRAEVERQLAEQERARLHDELDRAERRLAILKTESQAWLTAANEADLASLITRLEQHQKLTLKLENMSVASADEITRLESERQTCLTQMALTQQRIEQLRAERPELLTLTPESVVQHRRTIEELDATARDLDQTLRTNEIRHGVLNQTTVDDAAALRIALRDIEAELERMQQLAEALELAIDTLRNCVTDFQENALDPVGDDATRLFSRMTGGRYQSVRLDQQTMEPAVGIGAQDVVGVAALSRGTRDQLYLAIRLALVDALSGGVRLPLIFDDPCVHFDADRLAATSQLLGEVARERQLIILTKDEAYTRWFTPALRLQPTALFVSNQAST